jgi:hypothetical protein
VKKSYREGIASHPGPEPCEGGREAALEALDRATPQIVERLHWKRRTGESVGWVLSSEIVCCGEPTASDSREGNNASSRYARARRGPAESKTPSMQWNSMRENREAPQSPADSRRAGRRRR